MCVIKATLAPSEYIFQKRRQIVKKYSEMRVVGTRTLKKRQRRKQTVNREGSQRWCPCASPLRAQPLQAPGLGVTIWPYFFKSPVVRTKTWTVTAGQVTSVARASMLPFIK